MIEKMSSLCNTVACGTIDPNIYLRGLPNPFNCTLAPACCLEFRGPVPVAIPGIDDSKSLKKYLCCEDQECNKDLHRLDLVPIVRGPTDLNIDTNLVDYWSWYPEFWKYVGLCNKNAPSFSSSSCCNACNDNGTNKCKSSFAIQMNSGNCFLRTPLVDQNYYSPQLYRPKPSKFVNCINPVFGL